MQKKFALPEEWIAVSQRTPKHNALVWLWLETPNKNDEIDESWPLGFWIKEGSDQGIYTVPSHTTCSNYRLVTSPSKVIGWKPLSKI